MLHSYSDLKTFAIRTENGRTGRVDDFYFDDSTWKVRYLVVHSGSFMTGRQSLIGADLLGAPDISEQEFPVALTEEQLKSAVPPESDAPVSKQTGGTVKAEDIPLWPTFLIGASDPYSPALAMDQLGLDPLGKGAHSSERRGDPHLRSMAEVSGCTVAASDGEFGSVIDFLIDPDGWQLQYLVIDTGNWLPGRQVVVTTGWITEIDLTGGNIRVGVKQQAIEDAPRLRDVDELKRSGLKEAMDRYGAIGYWPV